MAILLKSIVCSSWICWVQIEVVARVMVTGHDNDFEFWNPPVDDLDTSPSMCVHHDHVYLLTYAARVSDELGVLCWWRQVYGEGCGVGL